MAKETVSYFVEHAGTVHDLRALNECDAAEEARAVLQGKGPARIFYRTTSEKNSHIRIDAGGNLTFAYMTAEILKRINRQKPEPDASGVPSSCPSESPAPA